MSQASVICLDDVEQDQPNQRTTQQNPKSDEQYLPNSFKALEKQGIFYHDTPPSCEYAKHLFIPTTDDKDWNSPEEHEARRIARRAVKHASRRTISNRSEFSWEADAWSDVFGRLRDDPCLEADKREYNIKVQVEGELLPKLVTRIPDATFGLATFGQSLRGNKVPKSTNVCHPTLNRSRLREQMSNRDGGLIIDPKWGSTELIFPWAVYEAKKQDVAHDKATVQACAAASVFLTMLDNLAKEPGAPETNREYQTARSHLFQIFAFTSAGPEWNIYVCHAMSSHQHALKQSSIHRIWSGNIRLERDAWELTSLVEQIHHFAATKHRDFVTRHLQKWIELPRDSQVVEHVDPDGRKTRGIKFFYPEWMQMKMPCWRRSARAAGQKEKGKRVPRTTSGQYGMGVELEKPVDEARKCHKNLPTMSQDGRSGKRRKLNDDRQSYVRNEIPQMEPTSAGYSTHQPILTDHAEEPEYTMSSDINREDNGMNHLDNFHKPASPAPLVQTKNEADLTLSASSPGHAGPACTSHRAKGSSTEAGRGRGFETQSTMRMRFTGLQDLAKLYEEALTKLKEKEERTKIWRDILDIHLGGLAGTEGVKESAVSFS